MHGHMACVGTERSVQQLSNVVQIYALYVHDFLTLSLNFSFTDLRGAHSGTSTRIDSKKGSSFAAESEAIIEIGGKEEDTGSIKEGGDLEMELNIIDEKADKKASDFEDDVITTTSFGMTATTAGALEEKDDLVKGANRDDAEQENKDIIQEKDLGLISAAATCGLQSDDDGSHGKQDWMIT